MFLFWFMLYIFEHVFYRKYRKENFDQSVTTMRYLEKKSRNIVKL